MVWSGSLTPQPLALAPCFVNNNYNIWDHLDHCVCGSRGPRKVTGCHVWYPCMRFTMKALAAAALGLPWSSLMVVLYKAMLWLCHGYIMALLWLLLWLLHQKGERLCFGYHASQERINIYAVPMAPGIFLQLPRSHLTYLDSTKSVNSVTSKTVGTVSGINGTI